MEIILAGHGCARDPRQQSHESVGNMLFFLLQHWISQRSLVGQHEKKKKNNPDLNRFKSCCLCMPRERPQASNADQLPVAWLSRKKVWAAGCRAQLLSFGRPPGPQTRVQRLRPLWQGHCCRFRQAAWGGVSLRRSPCQGLKASVSTQLNQPNINL